MAGPLAGVAVIELAGIGPGPFAGMVLADLGADVLRIERCAAVGASSPDAAAHDLLQRGKRSVGVDLKHPEGVELVLDLVERADVLIEGYRPGDPLHFLYGIIVPLIIPFAYGLVHTRPSRRQAFYYGIATLFIVGLAIRAIVTGR